LWLDLQPVDIKSRWRHNWKSAQVVNSHLVCDPTIRQPGFDLPYYGKWHAYEKKKNNLPNCQLNRLQQITNSLARAVVKAPKSTHITPILKSLHWLKVNERIEYKLLSLTYKVLTTAQPSYLHNLSLFNLLAVPALHLLSLSCPPTISSLKITYHSFRYALPRLWNQLPDSFRQPHHSCLDSPPHPLINSSLSSSPLSSSITPSLFHSRLRTYLFNKSFPP